jgi:hypothetical protein
MKVYALAREHYSIPQVLVIVAKDYQEAYRQLAAMLKATGVNAYTRDGKKLYKLKQIRLDKPGITTFLPPGDRQFIR